MESNKDRHDAAIYAFTIVTIIFLPLSFVAGLLGMNTQDIRNLQAKQWLFWAIGVPLTAIVIVVALIWAGEFGNAWRAITKLFSGSSNLGKAKRHRPMQMEQPALVPGVNPFAPTPVADEYGYAAPGIRNRRASGLPQRPIRR